MTGPDTNTDTIQVAIHETTALICVRGRGSFKMGPAMKQFGMAAMEHGCRQLILDMDACIGMDSTFMGVLAGLAMRLKGAAANGVVVMNLNPKLLALLRTLGLDRMIDAYEEGQVPAELKARLAKIVDTDRLDASLADKKVTLETMLTAHQDLVRASPDNLPKFQSVLEYLSQDLSKLEEC